MKKHLTPILPWQLPQWLNYLWKVLKFSKHLFAKNKIFEKENKEAFGRFWNILFSTWNLHISFIISETCVVLQYWKLTLICKSKAPSWGETFSKCSQPPSLTPCCTRWTFKSLNICTSQGGRSSKDLTPTTCWSGREGMSTYRCKIPLTPKWYIFP